MEEIVSVLRDLRKEVLIFPGNDILVNLQNKPKVRIEDSNVVSDGILRKIWKEAVSTEKNSGINPVCISEGTLTHRLGNKEVVSPVFLLPAELVYNSKKDKFTLTPLSENKVLNPFLVSHFEISIQEEESIVGFDDMINATNLSRDMLNTEIQYIGNFHPKRFSFLREIEHLIYEDNNFSEALKTICGNESKPIPTELKCDSQLFNSDQDQLKVFERLPEGSLVVQGPPGTGKSQVIGNLIASIVNSDHNVLLISEKKVALDVIQQKLKSRGLEVLSFQIPSKYPNRALIVELKQSWDYFIQMENRSPKPCFKMFDLQRSLYERLVEEAQIQGCRVSMLVKILEKYKNTGIAERKRSKVTISDLDLSKEILSRLPPQLLGLIKYFKASIIEAGFEEFIDGIHDSIEVLQSLNRSKNIRSWEQLQIVLKELLTYHSFDTNVYKKFGHLITYEDDKFKSLYAKYAENKRRLNALKKNQSHWLVEPSQEEVKYLKNMCSRQNNILQRIRWSYVWKKWVRTPGLDPKVLINERTQYLRKNERQGKILNDLFRIGIKDPERELPIVDNLINSTDKSLWLSYQNDRDQVYKRIAHKKLYGTLEFLKHGFEFDAACEPLNIIRDIENNKNSILEHWPTIHRLPTSVFRHLSHDINHTEENIKLCVTQNLMYKYPELKNFSLQRFVDNCEEIQGSFEKESTRFADNIKLKQYAKFQKYETLTRTPTRKLNEEQKALRKRLKNGKSILIKEFGKKRAHRSIRSLFQSDAFLWLQVLKPIWMANPSILSSCIPLKKEQFDYLIADEASQLLLSHSIGALHRGKQTVICGDPQQMAPGSYFKKKQNLEIDLLHHANYYLNHVFLSNHYRSMHPGLIQFSNTYFYNNKLKAFQHTEAQLNPIKLHYVENGRYSDRVNIVEAKQVGRYIEEHIDSRDKLGIVAFSEAQLDCIYSILQEATKMKLEQRIQEDTLFFQALEKVQGDECDRLIISFGYGYNEENRFEMRFGPVNYNQGHKRLNVLFSRAKKKIDFFASVTFKDFPASKNEGVNLIKNWFRMIDSEGIEVVSQKEISMYDILDESGGFHDLISYINVYSSRGYSLIY